MSESPKCPTCRDDYEGHMLNDCYDEVGNRMNDPVPAVAEPVAPPPPKEDAKRARNIRYMAHQLAGRIGDRLIEGKLVDEAAVAEAEEEIIELVGRTLSGLDFNDIWTEFLHTTKDTTKDPIKHCGLCGNRGIIDTKKSARTSAGWPVGIRAFCICPNGRAMKSGLGLPAGSSSVAPEEG